MVEEPGQVRDVVGVVQQDPVEAGRLQARTDRRLHPGVEAGVQPLRERHGQSFLFRGLRASL
jgi:hypothetical protein